MGRTDSRCHGCWEGQPGWPASRARPAPFCQRRVRRGCTALIVTLSASALAAAHISSNHAGHPAQRVAGPLSSWPLGDTTIEAQHDFVGGGQAEAFQFTASATGQGTAASVYIDAGNTARTLRLALYADGGGSVGRLLSTGARQAAATAGWNVVPIKAARVIAGSRYWLAVLGAGGSLSYRDRSNGPCVSVTSAASNLGAFPEDLDEFGQLPRLPDLRLRERVAGARSADEHFGSGDRWPGAAGSAAAWLARLVGRQPVLFLLPVVLCSRLVRRRQPRRWRRFLSGCAAPVLQTHIHVS